MRMEKGHQETLMRSSESPGNAESRSHVLLGELVGKVFMDPGYLKVQRKRGDHCYEILHISMQRYEWG